MRYILNRSGYIYNVSFGAEISCSLGNCTEYTGKIPNGYSSIEEWHDEEIDRLNAWKVVDGNLIFDSNRAKELERICSEQSEKNRCVTKCELDDVISNIEKNGGEIRASNSKEIASILPTRSANGKIIVLDDASSFYITYFKLTSNTDVKNEITIISSLPNIMPNEAITKTENGLTLTVNEDRSISVSGTATGSGTLTIAGTISNRNPLMTLKANVPYCLAKLPAGYKWAFYYYDGNDREQVYFEEGGAIELLEDKQVTHIELVWTTIESIITESEEELLTESGLKLMLEGEEVATNVTIYPMLNVGNTALEYQKHEENRTVIDLSTNTLKNSNSVIYENGICKIGSANVTLDRIINTYNADTVIYSLENVYLEIDYKKSSFEYVTAIGSNGALILKNTADGYGSIRKLTLENLVAGSEYTLTSSNGSEVEEYIIDLSKYTGTVSIIIEEGLTTVIKNGENIGTLENIYIKTHSPKTYLEIDNDSNMICEYMVESDFSIYCTRVEKDASIKIVEDMIKLEVSRASEIEGELRSSITVEADKITQIVESVGNSSGKVTPASIIQAINEDGSSIQISADKIDIEGTTFPEISNSSGSSTITALSGSNGIKYNSSHHLFTGNIIGNLESASKYFVISHGSTNLIEASDDQVVLGDGRSTYISLNGTIYINGVEFDGTAKFG